jgi:hypothetical protein
MPFYSIPGDAPTTNYAQATVSVGTTATLIGTFSGNSSGVLIQNGSTEIVYLGGPTVTSSGATQGYALAISSSVLVPTYGGAECALYGITSTSTTNVSYLHPVA